MILSKPPPESEQTGLLQKSLSQLGWSLIQNALAAQTFSPVTASLCRALSPEPDWDATGQLLAETSEMVSLQESGDPFPISAYEDVRILIADAREKQYLEAGRCLQILKFLRLCRALQRALAKKHDAPLLQSLGARLDPPLPFLKELEQCISDDGEIREDATPELKQAIRDAGTAKQKLEQRLAKLFSTAAYKEALQDSYFTEREERLVIPIRSEYRSRIEGIVHDSSGSGQTVFMEPTAIIPLNNQLKINRLRVEQEKLKILKALASQTVIHALPLQENLDSLSRLDLIHARARLAKLMSAKKCPLNPDGKMNLIQARNPELILNRQKVVPNDIFWDASTRVIIISGPNTGGKTVTLKTIGLMSLMARAGLFLPVAEASEIGFFPEVYADIGDDQSIELNLSTFSGHLKKIILILKHAGPGALILLDELGIATDPFEGSALAEAILIDLKQRNVTTLVSTHYLSLKTLAQTHEGFLNACTEFNPESLAPTYRLIFGVPGDSAALDTAQRLGLPDSIIKKAREIYDAKDNRAEILLQSLTRQKFQLEQEQDSLREKNEAVDQLVAEQKHLTVKLRIDESEFQKNKTKKLQAHIREAKNEIRKLLKEVKEEKSPSQIRRVEKQLQSMGRVPLSASGKDFSGWEIPPENLTEGDSVLVLNYGALGILLENPDGKKRVRVQLGNLATLVDASQIRGNARQRRPEKKKPEAIAIRMQTETSPKAQTSCDLRGMNSEEALDAIEQFLSQAIVNRLHQAKIIHGHGMGTIKKLVREYLETTGMGKSFRPGSREEGGDGITVVEF